MFKMKTLWIRLAVTAMMLIGGSMTAYASETLMETTEMTEAAETAVTETEETAKVITIGQASQQSDTASETSEETDSEETAEEHAQTNHGLQSLGVFRTTGYCPCYQCSEGWGRSTSTGAIAKSSHTIAVDPRVIPYGTKLMINGVVYTAEDRGGGVKGNHIDIFFDNHAQTRQHGSRHQEVFLVV